MIWGAEEIDKKNFEALLQEKKLEGPPPGKKKLGKALYPRKKKLELPSFRKK